MSMLNSGRALRAAALAGTMLIALGTAAASAEPRTYTFDIGGMTLSEALRAYARVTGQQIIFTEDLVAGRNAPLLKGAYGADEALAALLQNSGLAVERSPSGSIMVRAAARGAAGLSGNGQLERVAQAADAPAGPTAAAEEPKESTGPVEKVTVTGSRIRGAKQASPVVTITKDEMKAQGATDLGQVVRNLPQSFAGGQNPGVSFGAGSGGVSHQNISGSSSLNLRGLGQDATLTLLNGSRLPYDGFTQATDVASIPIAAIERMEVLLDGASAIYGSDAVGGVANVILKRDYDGVEFAARWGEATNGGFEQQQYTGVGGTTWSSGGFIATADFNRHSGIKARQRDYVALPPDSSIYSASKQTGGLFSGHQQLGDLAELSVDAFYTERKGTEALTLATTLAGTDSLAVRETTIWGVMPALRFALPGDWSLRVHGAVGQNETELAQFQFFPDGTPAGSSLVCYCNDAESVGVETEGPLFDLPGGEARLAFGGGYRGNEFESVNLRTGATSGGDDSSQFVYGELYLPLISEEQGIPLIHKLSLEGAVRYEDYKSFGETTTPKVGAIWGVTSDLDIKATWGKSFKVPTLLQQFQDMNLDLFNPAFLGGGALPVGSGVLFLQGGNPDLTPERAETLTAGFVAHPDFFPGFNLEVSWFDIDYTDRIVQPINPIFTALSNPVVAEFITFNPTVAEQNAVFALAGLTPGTFSHGVPPPPIGPYDPARIVAIIDYRYVNSASQKITGVDLTARYTMDIFGGSFTAGGSATWLEAKQTLTAIAPEQPISGIVFFPAEFRGRIGGTWTGDNLMLSANLNHTAGVTNNLFPTHVDGDGFTTVDVVVDYVFEAGPLGGGFELTFGVQNLLDEDPPLMQPLYDAYANYDSTNYSAIGRVVNVTVTQRF